MHKSTFIGVNFPANGPVMQKKTLDWERSTEKILVHDGVLKGFVTMFLVVDGGGSYRCEYQTTYKYVGIVGTKISRFC